MRDRPLRVVVVARAVSPWHGRGGLERHVADLVRHLARRGLAVTLVTRPPDRGRPDLAPLSADAPAAPVEHTAGAPAAPGPSPGRTSPPSRAGTDTPDAGRVSARLVPYLTFPGAGGRGTTILDRDTAYLLFGWRAGRAAARLVEAGAADIVHGLGASVLGYAWARRRGAAAPLVLNPQGLEEFGGTDPARAGLKRIAYWPLQRAVRACARAADRVLATDRTLLPVVLRHLGVDPARVPVVPNAVDLAWCDAMAGPADGLARRARLGWNPALPVLLSVGRLERNKGFHVLVEALHRLAREGADFRWVIVGDGPYRGAIARRAAALGLQSRIMWAGRVEDPELHAWYEAATLFVHPTLYEGSSLVTLEAMAHRRAVVATTAGGLPDKVRPGVTGWLVPPGDAAALAAALREALASGALDRMGAAGRAHVERAFAWPAVAAALEDLYRSLLPSGTRTHGD
jgi:glycogen(starch) synthase